MWHWPYRLTTQIKGLYTRNSPDRQQFLNWCNPPVTKVDRHKKTSVLFCLFRKIVLLECGIVRILLRRLGRRRRTSPLLASSHCSREEEREKKITKNKRESGQVVQVKRRWGGLDGWFREPQSGGVLRRNWTQENHCWTLWFEKKQNLSVETVRPFSDSLFLVSVVVCVPSVFVWGRIMRFAGFNYAIRLSSWLHIFLLFFFFSLLSLRGG